MTEPPVIPKKRNGVVAILDALGTSQQHHDYVEKFFNARARVLDLLSNKIFDVQLQGKVSTFTFGDTILITMTSDGVKSLPSECRKLMQLLRKFLVDSLDLDLLFRGALAIGEFYAEDSTNTVLGPAVEDAAAWYQEANWIGLHATPRSSLRFEEWSSDSNSPKDHLLVDYDVPLKGGSQSLKTVNWPKVLFVDGIAPAAAHRDPRKYLLTKLTFRQIPRGTEVKYANTIEFYDAVVKKQQLKPIDPPMKKARAKRPGSRS